MQQFSRREALALGAAGVCGGVLALGGCAGGGEAGSSKRVVVYSSIDREVIEPVLGAFNRAQASAAGSAGGGLVAELVGDTEATKTTGLMQRLLSEKDRPRADVWLSSEAVGTVWLAKQDLLAAWPTAADGGVAAGEGVALVGALAAWPTVHRTADWVGMALRQRRIVYNTRVITLERRPRSIEELCRDDLRGRVVIAKARFGTTRGHVALLHARLGDDGLRALATKLGAAGVRQVDGNAGVVRAVARGEAHAGLTDCDDVYAGQREGWPVDFVADALEADLPMVPTTLALVRGGPNPRGGVALATWLLDGHLERALAGGDWRAVPVSPAVRAELNVQDEARAEAWETLDVERALSIWERGLA